MYYPTIGDVKLIIKKLNKIYKTDIAIINEGQLEFALEKPKMRVFGQEQYSELYQKAAVLMETLTKAHSLSDGNKRVAITTAQFMIDVNGAKLVLPLKSIKLLVDTAMDETDSMTELIQQWFKVHTAMDMHQLCAMLLEKIEENTIIQKLLDAKQYASADALVSKWMAFDSYPEHKKAWTELTRQWETEERHIKKKIIKTPSESELHQKLPLAIGVLEWEDTLHDDHVISTVQSIDDLQFNTNSMEELQNREAAIREQTKKNKEADDPKTIRTNAILLEMNKSYVESLTLWSRLQDTHEEADAALHIAHILQYEQNRPKHALEFWNKYKKHHPESVDTDYHIAVALKDLAKYDNALDYCKKVLEKKPDFGHAILLKGLCHYKLSEFDDALKCYKRCISINQTDINAYAEMASTYRHLKQYEKALECSEMMVKLEPDFFAGYYYNGIILHDLGKYNEAINQFGQALKLRWDEPEILLSLGSSISDSGRRKEAIPYFENVLVENPNHRNALYNLGLTLIYLGRYDEALKQITVLQSSDPENDKAKWLKAIVFANTGNVLECLVILEDLCERSPELRYVLRIDKGGFFTHIKDSERFKILASDSESYL